MSQSRPSSSGGSSLRDLLHPLSCQGQILRRSPLALLDEAVQQDHTAPRDAEHHTRDAVAGKAATNLPEPCTQRPAYGHSYRPPILGTGDVLTDHAAVLLG